MDQAQPAMRIGTQRDGAVLVLTLDYPSRRNALAVPLRTEMESLLEAAQSDGTRCIVLTGAAGIFSAGGDISGMNVETALEGRERMRRTHRLVRLMARGNVPIIAAVEGWAAGAGCSLALLCDHVVAAEDAKFVLGFHRIGLMADLALPLTLPARIGLGRARDMMLFHTQYTGAQALGIGLVDAVAPPGEALEHAMAKARLLAAEAPQPIAYMKQWFSDEMEAALAREADWQAALFATADHREGREAFLAKRKPAFTGR